GCVRTLTENGANFGETRDKVRRMRESLDADAFAVLRQARLASEQVWQRLQSHSPSAEIATKVEELKRLLVSEQFLDSWDDIAEHTNAILGAYKDAYLHLFERRKEAYETAIGGIKNRTEWGPLEATNPAMASPLLSPLLGRVGTDEAKYALVTGWSLGKASMTGMDRDL